MRRATDTSRERTAADSVCARAPSPRRPTAAPPLSCSCAERRGFWNGLQSVSAFGWSGSAALGGVLIERRGFEFVFFVTCGIQMLSWLVRGVVVMLVPRQEVSRGVPAAASESQRLARGAALESALLREELWHAEQTRGGTRGQGGSPGISSERFVWWAFVLLMAGQLWAYQAILQVRECGMFREVRT